MNLPRPVRLTKLRVTIFAAVLAVASVIVTFYLSVFTLWIR